MAGEYEVWTGLASVPCADKGISQAMAGGGGGVAIARDGREGSMGRVKWGGCWPNHSARMAGTRWCLVVG